jgi:TM2 domain-containing membrane protein YozV
MQLSDGSFYHESKGVQWHGFFWGENSGCQLFHLSRVGTRLSIMNRLERSYLLWLGFIFFLAGLHRIHNGKVFTGLLWLFTWGLFGFGQFIDLLLIPNMVQEYDAKLRFRYGYSPLDAANRPQLQQVVQPIDATPPTIAPPSGNDLMIRLLHAAEQRGGRLSVTQGVLDTGESFAEVESVLKEMTKTGYVGIDNDPATGIIVYVFREL